MEKTVSYQIAEEMRQFQQKLEMFNETCVGDLEKSAQKHAAEVDAGKQRIEGVTAEKQALLELLEQQMKRAAEEQARVQRMQAELAELEERREGMPAAIERVKADQEASKRSATELADATKRLREERARQMTELAKGVTFYRQRLGLEFVASDGQCHVSFKYIDPARPTKEHSFGLVVTDENRYEVHSVEPAVEGVDEMLAELNARNDFSRFIQRMRRAFKATVAAVPSA